MAKALPRRVATTNPPGIRLTRIPDRDKAPRSFVDRGGDHGTEADPALMLRATRRGGQPALSHGLNDVVFTRRAARMIECRCRSAISRDGGEGAGLIVATPTGSTAYTSRRARSSCIGDGRGVLTHCDTHVPNRPIVSPRARVRPVEQIQCRKRGLCDGRWPDGFGLAEGDEIAIAKRIGRYE